LAADNKSKLYLRCILSYYVLASAVLLSCSCGLAENVDKAETAFHKEVEAKRGPHNGKLLKKDNFSLELQIFELGVPPRYRIYGFEDGVSVAPKDFKARVEIERIGGEGYRVLSYTNWRFFRKY
jgi:hypothetical protein